MLCQKRLRLSWKIEECKPLPGGGPVIALEFLPAPLLAGAYTRSR